MHLDLVTLVVDDYDRAIHFFTTALGFDLVEDSPAQTTHGGRPKRWVVVRPPGATTGILLGRADGLSGSRRARAQPWARSAKRL